MANFRRPGPIRWESEETSAAPLWNDDPRVDWATESFASTDSEAEARTPATARSRRLSRKARGTVQATKSAAPAEAATPESTARFGKPAGRIPIAKRVDPGKAALVAINKYGDAPHSGDRVFHLTPDALAAFQALRASARAAGYDHKLFSLTSAYRSAARQAELAAEARAKHGKDASTWVAQNKSEHITGRAFDLSLGLDNSSANAKAKKFNGLAAFQWLQANAQDFGLNAYDTEPWHWSYNVL